MTTEESFQFAISYKRKVHFRMEGTPEGAYILFHPYALTNDLFKDEVSIVGLVERHHTEAETNYFGRPTLKSILEIIVTDDIFEPVDNWNERIKDQAVDILKSV